MATLNQTIVLQSQRRTEPPTATSETLFAVRCELHAKTDQQPQTSKHRDFKVRYCVMLLLFQLACSSAAAQYADLESFSYELQREKLAAVVRIHSDRGTGTGFIIAHDVASGRAFVMTAFHVVASNPPWIRLVRFYADSLWPSVAAAYDAEVVVTDEIADLAILSFDAGLKRLPTLQLARKMPTFPCEAFSIGCANADPPSVSPRQLVSREFFLSHRSRLTKDSSAGIGGQSGGPLFSQVNGHVIGVTLCATSQRTYFANLSAMHELTDRAGLREAYAPQGNLLRASTLLIVVVKLVLGIFMMCVGLLSE